MWKHFLLLSLLIAFVSAQGGGSGGGGAGDDTDIVPFYSPTPPHYTINLSLSFSDFLGECDEAKLNQADLYTIVVCSSNAISPAIPNPIDIFKPIFGDRLKDKLQYLNILPVDEKGITIKFEPLSHPLDTTYSIMMYVKKVFYVVIYSPIVILGIFVELIFNLIKYLMVFAFKFAFTYLMLSLAFQAIVNRLNIDSHLESQDMIEATFGAMVLFTIVMFSVGGGWLTWF